ncbi:MAG: NTP transferase domain-containing protein [Acidimicrobiia bacterium]
MTVPTTVQLAGVVLAGGASSRMGVDKAFVEVGGRPMVLRVVDALRAGGCDRVTCQGGDADRLATLGLSVSPDVAPGRAGPVRAIADALAWTAGRTVVVAACDLPDLTGAAVAALVRAGEAAGRVAVARADGRRHLVAVWPVGSGDLVAGAIDRGVRSYGDLLVEVGAVDVAVDPSVVRNVNTPDDVPGRSPGRRYPRTAMTVPEISVDELAPLIESGARLVDVREPDEYEAARVPGGVLVPLATVPDRIDDFRSEGTTYVICRSGARSMRACEFLAERGVDVANVAGGTLAWIDSGRDVAAGPA